MMLPVVQNIVNCKDWKQRSPSGTRYAQGGWCAAQTEPQPVGRQGGPFFEPHVAVCRYACKVRTPVSPTEAPLLKITAMVETKPKPTVVKVLSFAQAVVSGARRVELDVIEERLKTCDTCTFLRWDEQLGRWCGRCSCGLGPEASVLNLAAYVENRPGTPEYSRLMAQWGCRHPMRLKPSEVAAGVPYNGQGWKR